jgi:hypothetical protein
MSPGWQWSCPRAARLRSGGRAQVRQWPTLLGVAVGSRAICVAGCTACWRIIDAVSIGECAREGAAFLAVLGHAVGVGSAAGAGSACSGACWRRAEGVGGMSEPVLADKVLVQVVSAEPGRADPRDHDLICGDGGEHEDAHAEDH